MRVKEVERRFRFSRRATFCMAWSVVRRADWRVGGFEGLVFGLDAVVRDCWRRSLAWWWVRLEGVIQPSSSSSLTSGEAAPGAVASSVGEGGSEGGGVGRDGCVEAVGAVEGGFV